MTDRKRCAYCAEEIRAEAVRCPHCRSRLDGFDIEHWHRAHEDARLGGVASAVAHALSLPVGLVRLAFVIAAFVHLVGVVALGVVGRHSLATGDASALETGLARAQEWARGLAGHRHGRDASSRSDAATSPGVPAAGAGVIHDGGDAQR
jgi:phage shock protein PspC (stress-responsive transcriptional regulator)